MTIKIAIIGGGAWGSALALRFHHNGHDVSIFLRDAAQKSKLEAGFHTHLGENKAFTKLNYHLDFHALKQHDFILLCTPAQSLKQIAQHIKPYISTATPLIITSKGIDQHSGDLLSSLLSQHLINPLYFLSGPSFAHDVAKGLPTAVTFAGNESQERIEAHSKNLSSPQFRLYACDDIIGVQLGGALKNILAIGAGIVEGYGLGVSARAALITRGFVEMQRLAAYYGANPMTLYGLSGLGDLMLTTNSPLSRNFAYGVMIGEDARQGQPLPSAQKTTEGIATAKAVYHIAKQHEIDMPICSVIYKILYDNLTISDAMQMLMQRENIWEKE